METVKKEKKNYCYILTSEDEKFKDHTYCGYTNNIETRLTKHNGEISGGAKATRGKRPWKILAKISGFGSKSSATSFETRLKHPTGKKTCPPEFAKVDGKLKSFVYIVDNYDFSDDINIEIDKAYHNQLLCSNRNKITICDKK